MSAFKLTRADKRRINDARNEVTFWRVIEGIVASRCPEGHHWTLREDREPTEEDGMKGSTWPGDRLPVFWMTPNIGCVWGSWNDPPKGAIAWCRIPDYVPPEPSPEDNVRSAFERWATAELDDGLNCYAEGQYVYESVRCAWAAWQAARADAGTPEPEREQRPGQIDQLITERDEAEEAMSQAYLLVTGHPAEWSNNFGYGDAVEDIQQALRAGKAKGGSHE